MGLLRKYLVENFGLAAARTVLTQFGFAHGWRMAEAMQAEFKWSSDEDWSLAGTRIHALEGLFSVEAGSKGPLSKEGVMLLASYEAEQHLLHFGRADAPMCWTICGLTSGYLSRIAGKEIYVLEDRCTGKGDAACRRRTIAGWVGCLSGLRCPRGIHSSGVIDSYLLHTQTNDRHYDREFNRDQTPSWGHMKGSRRQNWRCLPVRTIRRSSAARSDPPQSNRRRVGASGP